MENRSQTPLKYENSEFFDFHEFAYPIAFQQALTQYNPNNISQIISKFPLFAILGPLCGVPVLVLWDPNG